MFFSSELVMPELAEIFLKHKIESISFLDITSVNQDVFGSIYGFENFGVNIITCYTLNFRNNTIHEFTKNTGYGHFTNIYDYFYEGLKESVQVKAEP